MHVLKNNFTRLHFLLFQSCDLKYVGQAFHGNQTATASDWELLRNYVEEVTIKIDLQEEDNKNKIEDIFGIYM